MLTCAALALMAVTSLSDLPALADTVEAEARTLTAETTVNDRFFAELQTFTTDAMRLSDGLRAAGVVQDLPCIFRGISQDSQERVTQFQNAHTDTERRMAFDDLHALLGDAILIAPMAASAANDLRIAQAAAPAANASAR